MLLLSGLISAGCQPASVSISTVDSEVPWEERLDSGVEVVSGTDTTESAVVINELHIDPDLKTTPAEFVELVNRSDSRIDLSGWTLCDGVSHSFDPSLCNADVF